MAERTRILQHGLGISAVEWHSVGGICHRVYQELETANPSRFDSLENIGIDETSYKERAQVYDRSHNHDTASVVWCAKGYGKKFSPNSLNG